MRSPTIDELETAAEWLDTYDGDGDVGGSTNYEHCQFVRAWLLGQAKAKAIKAAEDQAIREHAKKLGVPVARVRKALREVRRKNKSTTGATPHLNEGNE